MASEWLHSEAPTAFSQKASPGPVSILSLSVGKAKSTKELKLQEGISYYNEKKSYTFLSFLIPGSKGLQMD